MLVCLRCYWHLRNTQLKMTEKGSRGSLKRAHRLEEEANSCSKLQVRDNNVLTAGGGPAAAAVPISIASHGEDSRAFCNSPAAKECKITRNMWSRDGIKSNVIRKEEATCNDPMQLERSNSCSRLQGKRQQDSQTELSRYLFRNHSLKETLSRSKSSRIITRSDSLVENFTGALRITALSKEDSSQTKKDQKHARKESLKRMKSSERRLAKQNPLSVS